MKHTLETQSHKFTLDDTNNILLIEPIGDGVVSFLKFLKGKGSLRVTRKSVKIPPASVTLPMQDFSRQSEGLYIFLGWSEQVGSVAVTFSENMLWVGLWVNSKEEVSFSGYTISESGIEQSTQTNMVVGTGIKQTQVPDEPLPTFITSNERR